MKKRNFIIAASLLIAITFISYSQAALLGRVKTWVSGETLTDSDLNAEFDNILNNMTTDYIDDASSNSTSMATTADPYPASVVSLPTTLRGEIQRMRYQLDSIIGETYWYEDPDSTIATLHSGVNSAIPGFSAHQSSVQSNISNSTAVTVAFGTEDFDQGGDFASNTFTADVAGKYQFNVSLQLANLDSAATLYAVYLITSNGTFDYKIDPTAFTSDISYFPVNISAMIDLGVSDTAYVEIQQTGGTSQTDIVSAYFSGYLVF